MKLNIKLLSGFLAGAAAVAAAPANVQRTGGPGGEPTTGTVKSLREISSISNRGLWSRQHSQHASYSGYGHHPPSWSSSKTYQCESQCVDGCLKMKKSCSYAAKSIGCFDGGKGGHGSEFYSLLELYGLDLGDLPLGEAVTGVDDDDADQIAAPCAELYDSCVDQCCLYSCWDTYHRCLKKYWINHETCLSVFDRSPHDHAGEPLNTKEKCYFCLEAYDECKTDCGRDDCLPPGSHVQCQANDDCCDEAFCDMTPHVDNDGPHGHCMPQLDNGAMCDEDTDCSSGNCCNGECCPFECCDQALDEALCCEEGCAQSGGCKRDIGDHCEIIDDSDDDCKEGLFCYSGLCASERNEDGCPECSEINGPCGFRRISTVLGELPPLINMFLPECCDDDGATVCENEVSLQLSFRNGTYGAFRCCRTLGAKCTEDDECCIYGDFSSSSASRCGGANNECCSGTFGRCGEDNNCCNASDFCNDEVDLCFPCVPSLNECNETFNVCCEESQECIDAAGICCDPPGTACDPFVFISPCCYGCNSSTSECANI